MPYEQELKTVKVTVTRPVSESSATVTAKKPVSVTYIGYVEKPIHVTVERNGPRSRYRETILKE
jgi:hypothetical protein